MRDQIILRSHRLTELRFLDISVAACQTLCPIGVQRRSPGVSHD